MKKILYGLLLSFVVSAHSHQGLELSLGVGQTNPFAGNEFVEKNSDGNVSGASLNYYLDETLAVGLGIDAYDFDGSDIKGEMATLTAKYSFAHGNIVHPYLVAGIGSGSTKNQDSDKHTGLGGKIGLGLEYDWSYVSVGALVNWIYNDKAIGSNLAAAKVDNAQAILPMLVISFHSPFNHEPKKLEVAMPAQTAVPVVALDGDGDGIVDADDKCPSTAAGIKVNAIGCAETEKASVKLEIVFAGGKSEIDPKFQSEIDQLAAFMKKFPDTKVEIGGHTDSAGSLARNTKLSQSRAEAVAKSLVAAGIAESRITAKGYGPTQPVSNNETPEGRAANRRVVAEISVTAEIKK